MSSFEHEKLVIYQNEVDSLSAIKIADSRKTHKFNPNFLSDYKGYILGMSSLEIDRLHKFRSKNKFVNSLVEFQKVTKVSDSFIEKNALYFKFPVWAVSNKKESYTRKGYNKDINTTSAREISNKSKLSYKTANRIVNFRNSLNGFLNMGQLHDVYELTSKEIKRIKAKFEIKTIPTIQKINLNFATKSELASLVYINTYLATNILEERLLRGGFKNLDELKYVQDFPLDRLESIKLYLTIN